MTHAWLAIVALMQTPSEAPPQDDVDAVLRELERESAQPAAPVRSEQTQVMTPGWFDTVTPVLALRLRPSVRLGHPTALSRPELGGQLRARVGVEAHPVPDV